MKRQWSMLSCTSLNASRTRRRSGAWSRHALSTILSSDGSTPSHLLDGGAAADDIPAEVAATADTLALTWGMGVGFSRTPKILGKINCRQIRSKQNEDEERFGFDCSKPQQRKDPKN